MSKFDNRREENHIERMEREAENDRFQRELRLDPAHIAFNTIIREEGSSYESMMKAMNAYFEIKRQEQQMLEVIDYIRNRDHLETFEEYKTRRDLELKEKLQAINEKCKKMEDDLKNHFKKG